MELRGRTPTATDDQAWRTIAVRARRQRLFRQGQQLNCNNNIRPTPAPSCSLRWATGAPSTDNLRATTGGAHVAAGPPDTILIVMRRRAVCADIVVRACVRVAPPELGLHKVNFVSGSNRGLQSKRRTHARFLLSLLALALALPLGLRLRLRLGSARGKDAQQVRIRQRLRLHHRPLAFLLLVADVLLHFLLLLLEIAPLLVKLRQAVGACVAHACEERMYLGHWVARRRRTNPRTSATAKDCARGRARAFQRHYTKTVGSDVRTEGLRGKRPRSK